MDPKALEKSGDTAERLEKLRKLAESKAEKIDDHMQEDAKSLKEFEEKYSTVTNGPQKIVP